MKKTNLLLVFIFFCSLAFAQNQKPKVFIFTDINIGGGDPDDRQSLVHLLWYADGLEIMGIVPDRWNAQGMEACLMAIDTYKEDFNTYDFGAKQFPKPDQVKELLAQDTEDAIKRLREAAISAKDEPLYVLVWGNMGNVGKALRKHPEISGKVRLITIGTGLKYGPKDEVPGEDCTVPNWNGPGRNEIYEDDRFKDMWWLEINWAYNGMFSGEGPKEMFKKLSAYGQMGQHMKFVTKDHPWAQYFRVGDTPSVLYLIDPNHNRDDPTQSSWAGRYKNPFPDSRPNYYTDENDTIDWDYEDPCKTWHNLEAMYAHNKSTLERERPSMYAALLEKLEDLYNRPQARKILGPLVFFWNFWSTDHLPPPLIIKKILPKSIAQSVRLPCIISQNPSVANTSALVVAIATNMMIRVGIAASLVTRPIRIRNPQRISNPPTIAPKNSGEGSPIFSNLPAPRTAGNKNFWIPSEKNTAPTINLMSNMLLRFEVLNMSFLSSIFQTI